MNDIVTMHRRDLVLNSPKRPKIGPKWAGNSPECLRLLSEVRIMHTEVYWAVIFLMWSFTGEIYAQWRILSCYCPQVVSQRWEYVLWRILTIYLDVIVLRWPLKGDNLAHWRILRCHYPQVVFQRWELWTLKDIEILLSSSGISAWYWDVT